MPLLAGANNESAITVQQLPPEPVIFGQTPAMRDVRQKLERVGDVARPDQGKSRRTNEVLLLLPEQQQFYEH